jgi:hypothetical protein
MKTVKFYYGMMYGFTFGVAILSILSVDYVMPGFYNYDMCSKTYMDSQGHPNVYDQPNSQNLISACYEAKNIILNPLLQFVTVYAFAIGIVRLGFLGPKSEFISLNSENVYSRFHKEGKSRSPI